MLANAARLLLEKAHPPAKSHSSDFEGADTFLATIVVRRLTPVGAEAHSRIAGARVGQASRLSLRAFKRIGGAAGVAAPTAQRGVWHARRRGPGVRRRRHGAGFGTRRRRVRCAGAGATSGCGGAGARRECPRAGTARPGGGTRPDIRHIRRLPDSRRPRWCTLEYPELMPCPYKLNVNGRATTVDVPADMPLLWAIRDFSISTEPSTAWNRPVRRLHGAPERAARALLPDAGFRCRESTDNHHRGALGDGTHPAQVAWLELDVPQCGYCQAGRLCRPRLCWPRMPSHRQRYRFRMNGNLCRCGTYLRIRQAFTKAAQLASIASTKKPTSAPMGCRVRINKEVKSCASIGVLFSESALSAAAACCWASTRQK